MTEVLTWLYGLRHTIRVLCHHDGETDVCVGYQPMMRGSDNVDVPTKQSIVRGNRNEVSAFDQRAM